MVVNGNSVTETMMPNKSKLKVVFADPPFGKDSKGEAVTESPNLGILYIIGYAKSRLPNVEFIYLGPFVRISQSKEIKPDVYAISFTTPTKVSLLKLSLKSSVRPENVNGCRGYHPTIDTRCLEKYS